MAKIWPLCVAQYVNCPGYICHNRIEHGLDLYCLTMFVCLYADPMFRGIYHGSAKHRGLLLLDAMFNTEQAISA